jgi:hypothetical protein
MHIKSAFLMLTKWEKKKKTCYPHQKGKIKN